MAGTFGLRQSLVALSAFIAVHGLAGTCLAQKGKGPASSAYEGTIGDWSLGRWEGFLYLNYSNSRMTAEPRIMIIQRLPDGKVGCRWAVPADLPKVGWAPRCQITATTLSLVTTADSDVDLDRSGQELEGRMRTKSSTRYRAHLKRVSQ
jgi:hypothetical protein